MAVVEAPVRRMSLEEFRELPEGPPYYEREPDGEVIEMASARRRHNQLVGRVFNVLDAHVRDQGLGQVDITTDVYLPSGRVYTPDLCFTAREKGDLEGEDGKIHGVPTMVAESISPYGHTRDRVEKFDAYRDEGVEWYWIIDSTTLDVEEYHLIDGSYVAGPRVAGGRTFQPGLFPDLEINLAELMGQ